MSDMSRTIPNISERTILFLASDMEAEAEPGSAADAEERAQTPTLCTALRSCLRDMSNHPQIRYLL